MTDHPQSANPSLNETISSARPRSPSSTAAFLLIGLTCLFTIPYYIPVQPSVSDSYRFGYNNHAALLLFLFFAAAFAWWTRGLTLPAHPAAKIISRKPLWIALTLTASLSIALSLAMRSFGVVNEAAYLTDRLRQLAAGRPLFTGFEFIYGPTMLYLPLTLGHILHLSLFDAYYISWILSWLAGVTLLWATLRLARTPHPGTLFAYSFLSFLPAIISYGTNYTPLRFVASAFFATLTWRATQTGQRPAIPALIAVSGLAWLLFYSPETGLTFFAGTLIFLAHYFARQSALALIETLTVFLTGSVILAIIGHHIHLFDATQAMSSGGLNFPLLPSIGSLLFLLLWLIAVCLFASTLLTRRSPSFVDYLILVGLAGLPGALGRCDPGHMFLNTFPAVLAVWIVLLARPYGRRLLWTAYILVALTLPIALYQSNNFIMMPIKFALLSPSDPEPRLRRLATYALQHTLGPRRTAGELAKWNAELPTPNPAWNTPPTQPILAPLGYRSNLRIGQSMPPVSNGFFYGLADVTQAPQVQTKIEELSGHPNDLLLFTADARCEAPTPPLPAAQAAADREARRQLLLNLQPFYLPRVRHRDDPLAPLCAYILANYKPTPYTAPVTRATIWQHR